MPMSYIFLNNFLYDDQYFFLFIDYEFYIKALVYVVGVAVAYRTILKNTKLAEITWTQSFTTSWIIVGSLSIALYVLGFILPFSFWINDWAVTWVTQWFLFLGIFIAFRLYSTNLKLVIWESIKTVIANLLFGVLTVYIIGTIVSMFIF